MKYIVKLVLAVLLLLCLADMPYGYFNFVRFVSAFVFVFFAYDYYKEHKTHLVFAFIALAVLFQPFVKVSLGRTMWNVVDVVVAVGLFILAATDIKKVKRN